MRRHTRGVRGPARVHGGPTEWSTCLMALPCIIARPSEQKRQTDQTDHPPGHAPNQSLPLATTTSDVPPCNASRASPANRSAPNARSASQRRRPASWTPSLHTVTLPTRASSSSESSRISPQAHHPHTGQATRAPRTASTRRSAARSSSGCARQTR